MSEEIRRVRVDGQRSAPTVGLTLAANYRFVILALATFLAFSAGLSLFAVGPMIPLIIGDYGITHSAASLLTSLVFLAHVGFAIPASMLVGRVGLKKLIGLGAVANAMPLLSFMAADGFPILLALRTVYSLGLVILFPTVGPLFMQWFPSKELPLVNGLFVAAVSLGITTSAFIAAPMSEALGWEATLSAFGAVSLLGAVSWLAFGRTQRIATEIEAHSAIARVWGVFRSRSTLLVAAADAGPLGLLTVALAWLPTFYNEVHGFSLIKGGALMGLMSLAGLISLLLASVLATRVRRRRPFLVIPGILTGFAGLGAFVLADSVAIYAIVVALGFACWFYLPALVTIPMELFPNDPRRVSIIFATLMSIGGIVSFIAPLTVGAITDVTGSFLPGLTIFAVLAWSLGIAGFLLPETGAMGTETMERDRP